MYVMGLPEKEERVKRAEEIFETKMIENFPKWSEITGGT